MYDHEWHVWVFKLVFFHLNLFCSSVLGFFFAFLRSCILYRPARLVYRASILFLKNIFSLDVFLSCHNFLCVRIVIFRFNCKRHTRLTSIFHVGFWQIDFRIVNRYHVSNEIFFFQDNAFNLAMQIKQTAQMHLKWWILKRQLVNVKEKKIFVFISLGWNRDNSDRTMNTQSNSCQQAASSIPAEPSS